MLQVINSGSSPWGRQSVHVIFRGYRAALMKICSLNDC